MNSRHKRLIREHLHRHFETMLRPAGGEFPHPFLMPGASYQDMLWDWDSWLCSVSLLQLCEDRKLDGHREEILRHARGCVLNYLAFLREDGAVPICVPREHAATGGIPEWMGAGNNIGKPVLAQFAAFLVDAGDGGDWLRSCIPELRRFHEYYFTNQFDEASGLFFWKNDLAIGVDNDPCTFGRPQNSSASIYLNSLMYRELLAASTLARRSGDAALAEDYHRRCGHLRAAIQRWCWDRRDNFFYSADLLSRTPPAFPWLHQGLGCFWPALMLRIQTWSGFLGLWAGLATPEQARAVARLHYRSKPTFLARAGVRTLAKNEVMYDISKTSNPSNWLGPVWIVANYLTFRGLVRYGLRKDALDLVRRTVWVLGSDLEKNGTLHEYYDPDTGEPVMNPGFLNWNGLVLNMIVWAEGGKTVTEF